MELKIMSDQEFMELKEDIERIWRKYRDLQDAHQEQTGQDHRLLK